MRAFAVFAAVAAVVVGGAVSMGGAAAASHRATEAALQGAAHPTWSPDGKQIAFASIRYASVKNCCGAPPSLYPSRYRIVRTSSRPGGQVRTVLAGRGFCCVRTQWAVRDRILVIPNVGLESVGVQGGKPKRLSFPSWRDAEGFILSPNRKYAAAAVSTDSGDPHSSWGIGLVKLSRGRDPVVVSTPLTGEEQGLLDTVLAFSPDSRQLVFRRASWDGWTTGPPSLLALPLSGGDPVPLALSGIPGASLVPDDVEQVQWSPDGRWIAFVENQTLEVVPTTGASAPHVLATDFQALYQYPIYDFSWSPTSAAIAYACCSNQRIEQLMTVHPDGTHLMNLLKDRPLAYAGLAAGLVGGLGTPQWSPDSSRLLFTARRIGHRTVHVWTIRANGRDLIRRG
jgi:Tol biopolymer transport system component